MAAKRKPRSKNKPGTASTHFDPDRRDKYMAVVEETGELALARAEVGISYEAVQNHRNKTPGFFEAEEEALRMYRAKKISSEIHRRAIDGVQKAIYHNGTVVGWLTVYSDRLLELHAKRHIPEYRDKVTVDNQHSGAVGLLSDLSEVPPAIRKELKEVLKKIEEHGE